MSSAIFPHTETVNYTKGLMLLHVPGMLTLCFMASTVKTRSVLKLSRSSLPSLQFYLSCSFREGTKARSRSQNSHQPPLNASDINLLSLSLFVKSGNSFLGQSDADQRQAGSLLPAFKTPTNHSSNLSIWKGKEEKGTNHNDTLFPVSRR